MGAYEVGQLIGTALIGFVCISSFLKAISTICLRIPYTINKSKSGIKFKKTLYIRHALTVIVMISIFLILLYESVKLSEIDIGFLIGLLIAVFIYTYSYIIKKTYIVNFDKTYRKYFNNTEKNK